MPTSGMSPIERTLRAKAAANARWAKEENRSAATAPGLRAAFKHYEDQVDPERKLPEKQRRRMAQNARRAHLLNMSRKAIKARRLAKGNAGNGDAA